MPPPSLPEIVAFLALLATSAALFWRRFGPVLATIRAARPEPGFSLYPIGGRVKDFIFEILLQSKVIRERPLPGLAHAFVFWGFCAFALITLNHFATGIGLPFLSRESWLGAFYFYFAAAFGFAAFFCFAIASLACVVIALKNQRFYQNPGCLTRLLWDRQRLLPDATGPDPHS